jgi:hypothetical protein
MSGYFQTTTSLSHLFHKWCKLFFSPKPFFDASSSDVLMMSPLEAWSRSSPRGGVATDQCSDWDLIPGQMLQGDFQQHPCDLKQWIRGSHKRSLISSKVVFPGLLEGPFLNISQSSNWLMNGFIHFFTVSSGWIFVDIGWKYDWPLHRAYCHSSCHAPSVNDGCWGEPSKMTLLQVHDSWLMK